MSNGNIYKDFGGTSPFNLEREEERELQARLYLRRIISEQTQALQEVAKRFVWTKNPYPIFNNAFNNAFSKSASDDSHISTPYHTYYYDVYRSAIEQSRWLEEDGMEQKKDVPRPVELMDLYTLACYAHFQTMFLSYYFAHPNIDRFTDIKRYIDDARKTILTYGNKFKASAIMNQSVAIDGVNDAFISAILGINQIGCYTWTEKFSTLYFPNNFNVVEYSKDSSGRKIVSSKCLDGKKPNMCMVSMDDLRDASSFEDAKKSNHADKIACPPNGDSYIELMESHYGDSKYHVVRKPKAARDYAIEKYILARIAERANTTFAAASQHKISPENILVVFVPITAPMVDAFNKQFLTAQDIVSSLKKDIGEDYKHIALDNQYFSTNPAQRYDQWIQEDEAYTKRMAEIDKQSREELAKKADNVSVAEQVVEHVESKRVAKKHDIIEDLSTSPYYSEEDNSHLYFNETSDLVDQDGRMYNGGVYKIEDGELVECTNPNVEYKQYMEEVRQYECQDQHDRDDDGERF